MACLRPTRPWRLLEGPLVLLACLLGMCLVAATAAGGSSARSRPESSGPAGINLGLAFDYSARNTKALARRVGYVFGGYFLNWRPDPRQAVRDADGYMPFDADPWPQSVPGHSLQYWQAMHPDWIVYQCDRKTPAYYGSGDTNVPLDFSDPAVRAWQMGQVPKLLRQGATGIAFDDFTFANFENRCGVYRQGVWTPLNYPGIWQTSSTYTTDMLVWLRDMSREFRRRFPTKALTVSLAPSVSGLANLKAVTPYVDMIFDEAGFTRYGTKRLSDGAWREEVAALEYLSAHGKGFDVNGIVNAADNESVTPAAVDWVLANYLLVKGPASYTYVYAGNGAGFTGSPSGYGTFYDRSVYHLPIGVPSSRLYASHGLELRNYSGGLVLVNPASTTSYHLALDRRYLDAERRSITSLVLPPATGIILLASQGTGACRVQAPRRLASDSDVVSIKAALRCPAL